jgi:hypothetical protein
VYTKLRSSAHCITDTTKGLFFYLWWRKRACFLSRISGSSWLWMRMVMTFLQIGQSSITLIRRRERLFNILKLGTCEFAVLLLRLFVTSEDFMIASHRRSCKTIGLLDRSLKLNPLQTELLIVLRLRMKIGCYHRRKQRMNHRHHPTPWKQLSPN